MCPGIVADALKAAPELLALGAIATGRWDAGWLAVLDNLRQMHRHVAVDVENLAVDHQPTEAANKAGLNWQLLQQVAVRKRVKKSAGGLFYIMTCRNYSITWPLWHKPHQLQCPSPPRRTLNIIGDHVLRPGFWILHPWYHILFPAFTDFMQINCDPLNRMRRVWVLNLPRWKSKLHPL